MVEIGSHTHVIILGAMALRLAHFGEGSGTIWIDESRCSGEESTLLECPAGSPSGMNNCDHAEDAGVRCPAGIFLPLLVKVLSMASLLTQLWQYTC